MVFGEPSGSTENVEVCMSDEIKTVKVMDLKGLSCPLPIVKVSKGIKEVAVGEVIEAQATDPGALTDFPAWARTSGNEIVKTEQEGDLIRFFIQRKA
jgi:TusA-related sulfurtransferase